MAERQSALKRAPARPALEALLAQAKTTTLSEKEIWDQMASFVYGNAPKGSRITKELARRAVKRVRALASA